MKTPDTLNRREAESLKVVLLGVHFQMEVEAGDGAALNMGMASLHDELRQASEQALLRQRRTYLAYWDALTYFELSAPPARATCDEEELALTLGLVMEEAKLRPELATEVATLPALAEMRITHHYYDPREKEVPAALLLRLSPGQLVRTAKGHRLREAGFYRQFELPVGPQRALDPAIPRGPATEQGTPPGRGAPGGTGAGDVDWRRLLAVAVLAHLRADLEIYFESGFRRLRRCQNSGCRAWFVARPMGGRQRFCSTLCRVQHARATAGRSGR